MTEGSETGHIISFALPLLGGNLLQQTYNIVDTIIVGRFLGDNALAAVGATGSITYLFYTLCIGLSIGAGVIISQLFGAGNMKKMRLAVVNSAAVTAALGIAVSIISALLAEPVLKALNVPDLLIGDAALYMRIACGGTAAVAAYNWINAVMRALGDSKTPLIFLGAASLLNAALDLLFVMVLGLGVGGAAWLAYRRFGAVWGEGVGLHGRTYAVPTMQGGVDTIKPYVDDFILFAKEHKELTFLVTRIGCGIAGFRNEEIAPLFKDAICVENIILPKEFVENILSDGDIRR